MTALLSTPTRVALACAAAVGALAIDCPKASAFVVLDNTSNGTSTPQVSGQRALSSINWVVKSFTTPSTPGTTYNLDFLRLGLSGTAGTKNLGVYLYAATNGGSPSPGFIPTGTVLASKVISVTGLQNTAAYFTFNPVNFGTAPGELGAFNMQPGTNYSLVFSVPTGQSINWTVTNPAAAPTASSGFTFLNSAGTSNGTAASLGSTTTAIAVTSWQGVQTNFTANAFTMGVTETVPVPALSGVSFLAGLAGYSRGLRRRIRSGSPLKSV